jgi:hypothetical protein
MNKLEALKKINIGERVAEQETDNLKNYFIKTYLWEQILKNNVDVVFGSKGSGKSALYTSLSSIIYELIDDNIILALAENPRGTIAFKDLKTTPPTEEFEFRSIWKLYFVLIITQKLEEFKCHDQNLNAVIEKLQESDLIPRRATFSSMVKMVRDYIRRVKPSLEPTVGFNEYTGGVEKIGVKISLSEPTLKQTDKGIVSVDHLLELLNETLSSQNNTMWLAIDRLDAIFQEDFDLEATALRTLFQVYIDLQGYNNIRLIIFLRDDIWNRIIEHGFRETSHITKTDLIRWDKNSLFELLMNRFSVNEFLFDYFNLQKSTSKKSEEQMFNKIFPKLTANGSNFSFSWLISRIEDGTSNSNPRELIQLVNSAIKNEINLMTQGNKRYDSLITIESIYFGMKEASKTKLDTLIAEYPKAKNYIFKLKGSKVRFKLEELRTIWNVNKRDAKIICNTLVKIGFFKNESRDENNPALYIPLIYRPALGFSYQH